MRSPCKLGLLLRVSALRVRAVHVGFHAQQVASFSYASPKRVFDRANPVRLGYGNSLTGIMNLKLGSRKSNRAYAPKAGKPFVFQRVGGVACMSDAQALSASSSKIGAISCPS